MENFEKELLNEEELEIYNGLSEQKKAEIEVKIRDIDYEFEKLVKRAQQFDIFHEDIVIIEKLDITNIRSSRILAASSQADTRVRMSYYGRVLSISNKFESGELQEKKKLELKTGDIVTFNPDAAYSLNVLIPKNEPSIWVLSIENIMARDNAFNMEQSLKKKAICEIIYEVERIKKNSKPSELNIAPIIKPFSTQAMAFYPPLDNLNPRKK